MNTPAPAGMAFDNCDGCRAPFSRRLRPLVMTISDSDSSLTFGICPNCACTLGGKGPQTDELSAKVEATARLRPNRMEAPR
jgi:hypothetical protein